MAAQKTAGPPKGKRPGWSRGLDILLRSLHIGVAGILLGGAVFQQPVEILHFYGLLVVLSGLGLVGTELHHSLRWPHEGRGLAALAHMLPIPLLHLLPGTSVSLLWVAMVLGGIGSHMPRTWRHWSLLYGRVVE